MWESCHPLGTQREVCIACLQLHQRQLLSPQQPLFPFPHYVALTVLGACVIHQAVGLDTGKSRWVLCQPWEDWGCNSHSNSSFSWKQFPPLWETAVVCSVSSEGMLVPSRWCFHGVCCLVLCRPLLRYDSCEDLLQVGHCIADKVSAGQRLQVSVMAVWLNQLACLCDAFTLSKLLIDHEYSGSATWWET